MGGPCEFEGERDLRENERFVREERERDKVREWGRDLRDVGSYPIPKSSSYNI